MKLYQAAHIIQEIHQKDVVFIEFEDGSEDKFNFSLKGHENIKAFIDLKHIQYKEVDKIKGIVENFKKLDKVIKKI